jgi:hypothetical protein
MKLRLTVIDSSILYTISRGSRRSWIGQGTPLILMVLSQPGHASNGVQVLEGHPKIRRQGRRHG